MMQTAIPEARVESGRSEIVIRCRSCGDSSDPKHAHLYIKVPQNNQELALYDCKKCSSSGYVDDEFLRKYDITDSSVLIDLLKHNDAVLKSPKYKRFRNAKVFPLINDCIRKTDLNKFKLDYINNRIGSNFTYKDILDLKIFLNLYDVINRNKLELTRHENITNQLDKNFIGFISYDNSNANMRKCTDNEIYYKIDKRYINYHLVDKPDSKGFYVIPTLLDTLNPSPIRIHIAEGPFDILSIYYNLNSCNINQNIYCSCGGKGFSAAIEFILKELGIINFEIHIYPDQDQKQNEINNVINKCIKLNCPIYEHHNIYPNEKDYGVPLDRINDNIFRRH
jgi:hypothetical protein